MSQTLRARLGRKAAGHEEESYWPGYVDALVNVVLNLLFLLAILTMAAFVLGHQAGRGDPEPTPPAPAQPAEPVARPPNDRVQGEGRLGGVRQGIPQRVLGPRGSNDVVLDQPQQAPPALWQAPVELAVQASPGDPAITEGQRRLLQVREVRPLDNGRLVVVSTPSNAWFMSQANNDVFRDGLRQALNNPQGEVVVWTNTDNDPQRRRQDYMRTIQMREWLLQLGLRPEQVITRLAGGGSIQNEVAPLFIWAKQE
jgi:hypothetical protein